MSQEDDVQYQRASQIVHYGQISVDVDNTEDQEMESSSPNATNQITKGQYLSALLFITRMNKMTVSYR